MRLFLAAISVILIGTGSARQGYLSAQQLADNLAELTSLNKKTYLTFNEMGQSKMFPPQQVSVRRILFSSLWLRFI